MSDRSGWYHQTPMNTDKGHQLYDLIGTVMLHYYGPGGRANNVTWEHMDGDDIPDIERPPDMKREKETWEEIAQRFLEANK